MIRSILEAETLEHFFWVAGKIDRFYKSDLGHIYFDLVDGHSSIRCMLRNNKAATLTLTSRTTSMSRSMATFTSMKAAPKRRSTC